MIGPGQVATISMTNQNPAEAAPGPSSAVAEEPGTLTKHN